MQILPSPPIPNDVWDALKEAEAAGDAESSADITAKFGKPPMLLPLKPAPVPSTGIRRCFGCGKIYAAFTAAPHFHVCPGCHSEHTVVVQTDPDPVEHPIEQCLVCGMLIGTGGNPCTGHAATENQMTSEQLAQWKRTLLHRRKMNPPTPRQETLFAVPPPPRPNAWAVEFRWKPHVWETIKDVKATDFKSLAWTGTDTMLTARNVWKRYSDRNITTERQAINQVARLRRSFPGKSFRVKAVSWNPTPLLP